MRNRRTLLQSALATLFLTATLIAGTTAHAQSNLKLEADLSTKDIGSKENPIGSLVADAMRQETKADIAFIAATYFTSDTKFSKGNLSLSDFLKVLEYKDDNISIVKLTGAQVIKAIEHGLYLYPKSNSGFLQFSGIVVTIDSDAEKAKHVLSVKVDGSTIENSKTYKVAMPTPLANGALAYFKVWKKDEIDKDASKKLDSKTLGDFITVYLKEHKTLGKGDERLIIKGKLADAK